MKSVLFDGLWPSKSQALWLIWLETAILAQNGHSNIGQGGLQQLSKFLMNGPSVSMNVKFR